MINKITHQTKTFKAGTDLFDIINFVGDSLDVKENKGAPLKTKHKYVVILRKVVKEK